MRHVTEAQGQLLRHPPLETTAVGDNRQAAPNTTTAADRLHLTQQQLHSALTYSLRKQGVGVLKVAGHHALEPCKATVHLVQPSLSRVAVRARLVSPVSSADLIAGDSKSAGIVPELKIHKPVQDAVADTVLQHVQHATRLLQLPTAAISVSAGPLSVSHQSLSVSFPSPVSLLAILCQSHHVSPVLGEVGLGAVVDRPKLQLDLRPCRALDAGKPG